MKFNINEIYHGFKLLRMKKVDEIKSTALIFSHIKSGAKLIKVLNNDDNKVFSISFRTPPKDDTGLPHIMEHSVLCGSRKFNTKEPFVELKKGSLNTFLNAMTFADKTMYPIASKNEKDYFNLMDVYMDAVLYPNIYKNKFILMQEGWHYELDDINDKMKYKGVVYNEMKGSFSSPTYYMFSKIQNSLFPDNQYFFESGGDPEQITELTYKQFKDYHKEYYHPSNSYIYLFGNADTLKELDFLNNEYLINFDMKKIDSSIKIQNSFDKQIEKVIEYPILENENDKDKTYLTMNFIIGTSCDPENYLLLDILEYILLETPASPLKKALIDKKIGKDVYGIIDSEILQPIFSIVVKDSNIDRINEFKDIVYDTLKKIVKQSLDKKLVEGSINTHEFDLREADSGYPKGLYYNMMIMNGWLYDKDPLMHLEYDSLFDNLRGKAENGYFEEFIEKNIINNQHSSILILKPKKGLTNKNDKKIKKKLEYIKKSMSENEIKNIVKDTKRLINIQSTPDLPEQLESIPMLSLDDISKNIEKIETNELSHNNIKILHNNVFTNKIIYLDMLFDTRGINQDSINYISLLIGIISKISTENYNYGELSNWIDIYTGGIDFYHEVYVKKDDEKKYRPFISVKSKILASKIDTLTDIINEIILRSMYNDKKRIKELIREIKSVIEMRINRNGNSYAKKRLYSYFSQSGMYNEKISGIEYYNFINNLERNIDNNIDDVMEKLKYISSEIFNKNNLLINITCDTNDFKLFNKYLDKLINSLPEKKINYNSYSFDLEKKNEGLLSSSQVQYVAKGYNYKKMGFDYTGKMQVLKTIIGYDFLWNNIRVLGGAYGAYIYFERNGNFFLSSYRDPNLKETLSAYDMLPEYLRKFDTSIREMNKYIIGTISRMDIYLTPFQKGEKAITMYLTGIDYNDLQNDRNAILSVKREDINNMAEIFDKTLKENYLCVFGNEEKIKSNKDIFNNLVKIFD